MTSYKYSTIIGEKEAPAVGVALPISTKQAIEICSSIRGKKLERAKVVLSDAIKAKVAIPFKRFTDGVGHKPGKMANGRYPKKACTEIMNLLNSAQANAQFKGLSSADLIIRHINAQKGANTPRYGRRRRFTKRTTVEVILAEVEAKKQEKKAAPKAEEKKNAPKIEEKKPEVKKEEPKSDVKDSNKAKPEDSQKPETQEKTKEEKSEQ